MHSVIDYATPVFHYSLPAYLMQELERVQKRAMRIICPGIEYQHALALVNLPTIAKHHNDISRRTFESICNDSGSKLKKLLPPLHECKYNLRYTRTFNEPRPPALWRIGFRYYHDITIFVLLDFITITIIRC